MDRPSQYNAILTYLKKLKEYIASPNHKVTLYKDGSCRIVDIRYFPVGFWFILEGGYVPFEWQIGEHAQAEYSDFLSLIKDIKILEIKEIKLSPAFKGTIPS